MLDNSRALFPNGEERGHRSVEEAEPTRKYKQITKTSGVVTPPIHELDGSHEKANEQVSSTKSVTHKQRVMDDPKHATVQCPATRRKATKLNDLHIRKSGQA